MSSIYDLILRRLVQQHPEQVLALAFGSDAPRFIRAADPTLPRSDRTADALLEAEIEGKPHLVEIELQAQRDSSFRQRLLDYTVRAFLRDDRPVLPVVIYLVPEAEGEPPPLVMRARDREVLKFDFTVVRLWDVDFSRPELQHPALWALSVLGKNAEPASVDSAEARIYAAPALSTDERLDLLVVLGSLSGRRFGLGRLSERLRNIMLDSPFWEEQREKVRRETAEQVRRETAEQARQSSAEVIRKIVENRGGAWSEQVNERLLLLDAHQLEQIIVELASAPDATSIDRILEATQH